ncbi:MAG: aa3-type cytochrome oxidase subunit CtaJ [Pseudonocardiaceae bacterium]
MTLRPRFTRRRRYRPGQEWNYLAVLWTAKPEALRGGSASHRRTGGARGGASGNW